MRNNYVFTRDEHCITLYKRVTIKDQDSKNFGKEVDKLIGHYSDIDGIIRKVMFLELKTEGSLKDLLVNIKETTEEVSKFVKECLK